MRRAILLATALATALALAVPAGAQSETVPERAEGLRISDPITTDANPAIDEELVGEQGEVQISVRMSEPSTSRGGNGSTISDQQGAVIDRIESLGGSIDGTVSTVLNAVFATIDASQVAEIADIESVISIKEVANYQLDLTETVPYIGASQVQDSGFDGSGVTVAVLDSGIDYYHANLGGSGDVADYENDDPTSRDGTFPTAKVVDGADFVGDTWPEGELAPDDDPLDSGPEAGHGTHVGHIIAGLPSGEFDAGGVAPGADLIAVKVCSSVSPSCSGVALLQGMEFAVNAGADIINMSLGSVYGQAFDDDLSAAVDGATAAGVLTVASAGNSADKPYVTGTPSAAPTALSVAQTQVPSAGLQLITVDGVGDVQAEFQLWSAPPTEVITGPVQYGDGAGGNLDGCAPFASGSLAGLIVLVDRGACNFTLKIANIEDAGASAGIIGLVAPGAPFSGGDGGDRPADGEFSIPGYMISQADSNAIKGALPANGTIDPANQLPLVGQMVGSSSRGPTMQFNNLVKPEIGAPGASVSAIAGSGTDTGPFGGTSGAAPMVSGSAALLLDAEEGLGPLEVKARLVNTGETDIDTDPFTGLAPITRIGGGEVRVDRAVASDVAAWEVVTVEGADGETFETTTPALSFGFHDVTGNATVTKTVHVKNYGNQRIRYDITPSFRYGDDESGAVTIDAPRRITVAAGGEAQFEVTISIDGSELDTWTMNSGSLGANPGPLTNHEFDGYVSLDARGEDDDIHLPWHVLPRKAADVEASRSGNEVTLSNSGVSGTTLEVFHLLATSEDIPRGDRGEGMPNPDFNAAGVAFYEVPRGLCSSRILIGLAVNTHERQTHANAPALFEFDLDINADGNADYAVFNADLSLASGTFNLSDGRNVVFAQDLKKGTTTAFFFTDHDTNSGNTVLFVCGEQVGLTAGNVSRPQAGFSLAVDIYFQGAVTDVVVFDLEADGHRQSPLSVGGEPVQFIPLGSGDTQTATLDPDARAKGALVLVRGGAPLDEEAIVIEK